MYWKCLPVNTGMRWCGWCRSRAKHACLWLMLLMLAECVLAVAVTNEYKFKAALIYKLTKFVEWPNPVHGGDTQSFDITVYKGNEAEEVTRMFFNPLS